MRGLTAGSRVRALAVAGTLAGCSAAQEAADPEESSRYLYVWAGDPDPEDQDFLVVIDSDSKSASYGDVSASPSLPCWIGSPAPRPKWGRST